MFTRSGRGGECNGGGGFFLRVLPFFSSFVDASGGGAVNSDAKLDVCRRTFSAEFTAPFFASAIIVDTSSRSSALALLLSPLLVLFPTVLVLASLLADSAAFTPPTSKNGCFNNSSALGLSSGFIFTHCFTKSLNSSEKLYVTPPSSSLSSLFSVYGNSGGADCGITNRARMGCKCACGADPVAASIAVIPRLQISAFSSYPLGPSNPPVPLD